VQNYGRGRALIKRRTDIHKNRSDRQTEAKEEQDRQHDANAPQVDIPFACFLFDGHLAGKAFRFTLTKTPTTIQTRRHDSSLADAQAINHQAFASFLL